QNEQLEGNEQVDSKERQKETNNEDQHNNKEIEKGNKHSKLGKEKDELNETKNDNENENEKDDKLRKDNQKESGKERDNKEDKQQIKEKDEQNETQNEKEKGNTKEKRNTNEKLKEEEEEEEEEEEDQNEKQSIQDQSHTNQQVLQSHSSSDQKSPSLPSSHQSEQSHPPSSQKIQFNDDQDIITNQQQYNTTPQKQVPQQPIQQLAITPNEFKFHIKATASCKNDLVIKGGDLQTTMVVFDRELTQGVWRFLAKATKLSASFGIGIIDANQTKILHPFRINNRLNNNSICYIGKMLWIKGSGKVDQANKEITSNQSVTAVVDLISDPHTFSLTINAQMQPFCVTHIPDKVKFVFTLGNATDQWKIISLKESQIGIDLDRFDEKKRYKYE
ncbi:MAG: hypothetical protein EZS28_045038, partial [Streblomastix strix]